MIPLCPSIQTYPLILVVAVRYETNSFQGTDTGNVNSQAINAEGLSYDTEMEFYYGATRTPTELHLRQEEDFVSIISCKTTETLRASSTSAVPLLKFNTGTVYNMLAV